MKYVDVWRQTHTNLESEYEKQKTDVWVGNETDNAELSEPWLGTIRFYLLEKAPRNDYM